jgi:hypothetical protein
VGRVLQSGVVTSLDSGKEFADHGKILRRRNVNYLDTDGFVGNSRRIKPSASRRRVLAMGDFFLKNWVETHFNPIFLSGSDRTMR